MRSQALIGTIDGALPPALFRRARAAVARLGKERLAQSYWTTFWMPLSAAPAHALEEAVLALAPLALNGRRAKGAEWWLGRTYTTQVPIEFHFDQDVKLSRAGGPLVHPLVSSVLFFNSVRGGQLAVTDQRPGETRASRMETVKPRANRYAVFGGDRYHGVLDADGQVPQVPSRKRTGPAGRLRLTLVVNFWRAQPTGVKTWSEARAYRRLR